MSQERYAAGGDDLPRPGGSHTAGGIHREVRWQPMFAGPVAAVTAEPPGPRWMVAGGTGLADMWAWWMAPSAARVAMESLDAGWLWSAQAQRELRGLRAADFFCDDPAGGDSPGDSPGERVVARLLEFLRALTAARQGTGAPCQVTVITRRAAFDVASPGRATLWDAVRALGGEPGAGIALRLADVGEPADLTALRWLTRHDVREREVAVRDGRLYAPRLVTAPGQGEVTATAAGREAAAGVGAGGAGGTSPVHEQAANAFAAYLAFAAAGKVPMS